MRNPLLAFLLVLGACELKGEPRLEIENAWMRPSLATGHSTAAYFTIRNLGVRRDKLIGVRSDVATQVTLHDSDSEGGIARMRPIDGGVDITAGGAVVFAPGGNHLMLEKLARPVQAGERIRLALRFKRSGERSVEFAVRTDAPDQGHAGH